MFKKIYNKYNHDLFLRKKSQFSFNIQPENEYNSKQILKLSKNLINSVINKSDYLEYIYDFEDVTMENILNELKNDDDKKTFWINVYNAYIRVYLEDNKRSKLYPNISFFEKKQIKFNYKSFSFDDIEHLILRSGKSKSMSILNRIVIGNLFKPYYLSQFDYRIHFALSFGSKSSPEIICLDENKIENQLNELEKMFILNNSKFNEDKNTLELSPIFSWYKLDFYGKSGVIDLHKKYGIVPLSKKEKQIKFNYKIYDWRKYYD